jgi:hypothetical protein
MSLVFVLLFAHFFLDAEPCRIVPSLTAAMIILGVCIIAKPPFLTGVSFDKNLGVGSNFESFIGIQRSNPPC